MTSQQIFSRMDRTLNKSILFVIISREILIEIRRVWGDSFMKRTVLGLSAAFCLIHSWQTKMMFLVILYRVSKKVSQL